MDDAMRQYVEAGVAVDWSRPIEAVHEDGRVMAVTADAPDRDGDRQVTPELEGGYDLFCSDGSNWSDGPWTIRNVATPANGNGRQDDPSPASEITSNGNKYPEALVERAFYAIRRHLQGEPIRDGLSVEAEFRAIVAELPAEVDADEAQREADAIAREFGFRDGAGPALTSLVRRALEREQAGNGRGE